MSRDLLQRKRQWSSGACSRAAAPPHKQGRDRAAGQSELWIAAISLRSKLKERDIRVRLEDGTSFVYLET